jgi:hypothetical protein
MPPQDPRGNITPPADDDDLYGVSGPVESSVHSELANEYMAKAAKPLITEAAKPPPRPRWMMLSGVFSFPFYLPTLGPWLYISLGLFVAGMLLLFWLGPAMVLGLMSARLIGIPTCAATILTLSYASACCLTIIEDTYNGWDVVEDWPALEWKEWVWSLARILALVLEAALVGLAVSLIGVAGFWLPAAATLAVFPFVLLGALADDAWAPTGIGRVLASLKNLWWAWGLFYLETTPLIVGWLILSGIGLAMQPVAVPFYSAPLFAMVLLIYARLLGRLARLIGEEA